MPDLMPHSPRARDPKEDDAARLAREARLSIAFEELIYASAIGAAVSALAWMAWRNAGLAFAGVWSPVASLASLGSGLALGGGIFLAAFAGALLIGAPLFRLLERSERHVVWPFYAAAAAVGGALGLLLYGDPASIGLAEAVVCLGPGLLIVRLFEPGIRRLWRTKSEQGAAPRHQVH